MLKLLPPAMSTVLAVAIIAAIMSTACGLLVMTTCIANDLYMKIFVKRGLINVSQEKANKISLGMTRVLPAFFGIVSVLLALNPPRFMGEMVWIGISGVSSATLAPMIIALLCPHRISAKSAVSGLISGEVKYLFLYLITGLKKCNGSRSLGVVGALLLCDSFILYC